MFGFPILKSPLRFSDVEVIAIPATLPPERGGEMKDPGNEVASEHATTRTLHWLLHAISSSRCFLFALYQKFTTCTIP